MKYSVLFVLIFVTLIVGVIPIYAQYTTQLPNSGLAPHPPRFVSLHDVNKAILEPFDQSDVVLVGKIVDVKELREESKSEYGISVEKYLKNPKPHDLITAIGDGIAKKEITDFKEVDYYNDPIFQKNDRVFAYLSSKDGKYVILPYSFALSKNLPTGPPPDNVWFALYKSKFYGGEPITISGKIKKAILYTSVIEYGANQTGIIEIYNPDRTKYLSDTLDIKPDGSFAYEFRIKGDLGISGDYEYNILDGFGSTGSTFEYISSPLKQFNSGITIDKIQCKEGLDLAVKKSNGHPICITNETKTKLEHMGLLWPSWIGASGEEVSENGAPFDFSLVYSFGISGKNVLDSAQSHFLADMVCDPPIGITINLSDTEKQTIWRSVLQNDFFSFGNFTQNCDKSGQCLSISPEEFTTLSVTGNGKTHTVQHRGSYLYNDNEDYLKFEEITEIINDILRSRENFENLPSPRCAYQ